MDNPVRVAPAPKHPARFSAPLIPFFEDAVRGYGSVLDPMAGTGRIHLLGNFTVGVEIEPEWASIQPGTIVGDCLALPFPDASFDAIVVSPTYGNRFADHHNAKDGSLRRSYTHDLGRKLHKNNSGSLHWGDEYRAFHEKAWAESVRVLQRRFVLNCKNHIRKGEEQMVTQWHIETLVSLGLQVTHTVQVPTGGFGMGANHLARVAYESIVILDRKGI